MTTMHSSSHNGLNAGNSVGPGTAAAMNALSSGSSTCVNPAQMTQIPQAGSSSASGSLKKKITANTKRKRNGTPDDAAGQQRKNRDGPRKKKANRACFHCQKAHLTCDDCECSTTINIHAHS